MIPTSGARVRVITLNVHRPWVDLRCVRGSRGGHLGFVTGNHRRRHAVTPRITTLPGVVQRLGTRNCALPSINDIGSAARVDVMRPRPLFTIGVFADAQYADRDDFQRLGEAPGRVKRFRSSKDRLAEALSHFMSKDILESMSCIINLGDLVDGVNDDDVSVDVPTRRDEVPSEMEQKNLTDLRTMVEVINDKVKGYLPVFHCLGNHDLNVSREKALEVLYDRQKQNKAAYFSKQLPRGWRLLVLDTTELNPRFCEVGSKDQSQMEEYVTKLKGNDGLKGTTQEDLPIKPWGGGIGPIQLEWLKEQLTDATEKKQKVIVASHVPLSRTAARPGMAAWNCDEVSALLEQHDSVKLCIAGHDHVGCYGRTLVQHPSGDGNFVFGRTHFVTVEAMLEAPAGTNAFAVLEVYDHEVIINAGGTARPFLGNPFAARNGDISRDAGDTKYGERPASLWDATPSLSSVGDKYGDGRKSEIHKTQKNVVTDRRLRTSPRGQFTGVASFWDRDIGGRGGERTYGVRVNTVKSFQGMDLLDWINCHVDDESVDLR